VYLPLLPEMSPLLMCFSCFCQKCLLFSCVSPTSPRNVYFSCVSPTSPRNVSTYYVYLPLLPEMSLLIMCISSVFKKRMPFNLLTAIYRSEYYLHYKLYSMLLFVLMCVFYCKLK
jgi:hypothetical protein